MLPNPVLTSLPSLNLLTTVDHSFRLEKLCGYKSWLCQLITVWPWASYLPPLGFHLYEGGENTSVYLLGSLVTESAENRACYIERHSMKPPHGCWWGLRHATSKHGMLNILRWGRLRKWQKQEGLSDLPYTPTFLLEAVHKTLRWEVPSWCLYKRSILISKTGIRPRRIRTKRPC